MGTRTERDNQKKKALVFTSLGEKEWEVTRRNREGARSSCPKRKKRKKKGSKEAGRKKGILDRNRECGHKK